MITLRIKYADSTVNITFPCTENTLAAKLMELHASDHEGDPQITDKAYLKCEIGFVFCKETAKT